MKHPSRETAPTIDSNGETTEEPNENAAPPAQAEPHDGGELRAADGDADATVDGPGSDRVGDFSSSAPATGAGRRLSISVKSLAVGALITGLIAALGIITSLYFASQNELHHQTQLNGDDEHAEQVALDYAVAAAIMDYKDLGPWKQKLVAGTTPELTAKLTKAADAMEQILLPMQWASTAKPIAAKVRSRDNGVYVVDAFVSVMTKTVQASDTLQSTATYGVTVDGNDNWHITDVGGIAAVVGDK